MTIEAAQIVSRASVTLQDDEFTRWPLRELVGYLNDGARELAMLRPDASAVQVSHPLAEGAHQTLPPDAIKILEVLRNDEAPYLPITQVSRQLMDAAAPTWYSQRQTQRIQHYMVDPRAPTSFYVYPPAEAGTKVQLSYSAYPQPVALPAESANLSGVAGSIDLAHVFTNALVDYVLYRAYAKDAEFANNAALAQAHYSAFTAALDAEVKATVAVGLASSPAAAAAVA